jgi:hypothetical protein
MRSAQAAKNATATIPIVFVLGFDPVELGLVASFNKPGGNITGTTIITTELATKRLNLLYDLDPSIRNVAILVSPDSTSADVETENVIAAAKSNGRPLFVLKPSSGSEIDAAFASAVEQQVRALIVSADSFFMSRRAQLVGLAATHRMPAVYPFREFVDDGGLMSYGPRPRRGIPFRGHLRWSHSQGHQAKRAADRAADRVRVCHQPQNRKNARLGRSGGVARHRGRSNRVRAHESSGVYIQLPSGCTLHHFIPSHITTPASGWA